MTFIKGQVSYRKGKHSSEETRKKQRDSHLGQIPWNKGKTGIYNEETLRKIREARRTQINSPEKSEEVRRKISLANKGRPSKLKGRTKSGEIIPIKQLLTKEEKLLRRLAQAQTLRTLRLGKKLSPESIAKRTESRKGYHHSEETKRKISESEKGKKLSDETKTKLRYANIEYMKKAIGWMYPNVGTNEKKILDSLQEHFRFNILRQYEVDGYFLDGYIPELRLAIEVDEKPKNKDKDIERQRFIEDKLDCKFIRIKDYD